MVTSRSVPQQTAQIFSPLAGQKRAALRFSQIGQDTESPQNVRTVQQNTRCGIKRQNQPGGGSRRISCESGVSQKTHFGGAVGHMSGKRVLPGIESIIWWEIPFPTSLSNWRQALRSDRE